ncbi:MAG: Flp pilus assembly protein CpaB [Hyphomicrobiales bacterium]|nr:MAG: Flp pilus assembly protein CpaB [Hyphomicrobiales bacterium]
MLGLAVVSGALAVLGADSWLSSRAEYQRASMVIDTAPLTTRTIVVAKTPLRFGNELSAHALREIPWPTSALPAGSFATIEELMTGGKRVVLAAIEPNEPVLAPKLTNSGERATLSALIDQLKRAITIRVDDVIGVAGFVLPGDRVDVLLTRQDRTGAAAADVILQSKRVLAVDQLADERSTGTALVKAVTLEVDPFEAQKTALAGTIGSLSLLLRPEGEGKQAPVRTATLADLSSAAAPIQVSDEGAEDAPVGTGSRLATVFVTGAEGRKEFQVPVE